MGSVRLEMSTCRRAWLVLACCAAGCGVQTVDTVDGVGGVDRIQTDEGPATQFSAADCAAAAIDAYAMPNPDFLVVSPATYNACGAAYTVDVQLGGRQGQIGASGGATFHHDLLVWYAGPVATTPAACHALYGAAYFYDHPDPGRYQAIGLKASPGWWLRQQTACVPPQVNLRDFDRYLDPSAGSDIKIAAAMRNADQHPLPLRVSAVQYSVDTPAGCSDGVASMLPDQGLFTGQSMVSCDGRFQLSLHDDGNLALAQKDEQGQFSVVLWSSGTSGVPAVNMVKLQPDGDLVISAMDGTTVWDSDTSGLPGQHLELSDDGDMRLYDPDHGTAWASNTGGH